MILSLAARLLLGAAAVAAVGAIVIVIQGIITRDKIKSELENRNTKDAIIEEINNCTNVVTLKELESGNRIEIQGDGISSDIKIGDVIYGHGKSSIEDYMKDLVGEASSTITLNDLYCDNIEIQDDDDLIDLLEDDDELSDLLEDDDLIGLLDDDDDDDIISIGIY